MDTFWEQVHTSKAQDATSWWQDSAVVWLDLLDGLRLRPQDAIVDVGSGSSLFLDALATRAYRNLTAVDLSATALERIRLRLGSRVQTVVADVRSWIPPQRYALWHDRAVFHFLTEESDRAAYRRALRAGLAAGGHVVAATFALDGPSACSGLPVQRYEPAGLTAALGFTADQLVRAEQRVHTTPWGGEQPFTIVVLRT